MATTSHLLCPSAPKQGVTCQDHSQRMPPTWTDRPRMTEMPNLVCCIPSPFPSVPLPRDMGMDYSLLRHPSSYAGWVWPTGTPFPWASLCSQQQLCAPSDILEDSLLAEAPSLGLASFPDLLGGANNETCGSPPGRESWPPITGSSGNTGSSFPLLAHVILLVPLVLQKDLTAATGRMCTSLGAGAEGRLPCHLLP